MMWLRLVSLACLVVVVLHLQMADADDRQPERVRTSAPRTGQSGGVKNSVQKKHDVKRPPPTGKVPGNKKHAARLSISLATRTTTTTPGPTTLKPISLPTRGTTVPLPPQSTPCACDPCNPVQPCCDPLNPNPCFG